MSKICPKCGEKIRFFGGGKFIGSEYVCISCYGLKKKPSDDKFLIEWKPVHEKGVHSYVVTNTLINSMSAVIIIVLLPKGSLMRTISSLALVALIWVVVHVWSWSSKEKM
jgi:hypothetical protein